MYKCGGERGSVVGSLYYLRCDRKEVLMRFGGECEDSGWEGGVGLEWEVRRRVNEAEQCYNDCKSDYRLLLLTPKFNIKLFFLFFNFIILWEFSSWWKNFNK